MACCAHCTDSETLFSRRTARRDLRRYRRSGMRRSTRMLVDALRPLAPGATLLDIGGGVGMVQHELIAAGVRSAVQADASAAYLDASRQEAERRGHVDRTDYRYGDFVQMADDIPHADLVVLDRVICCYPDAHGLIQASASKARVAYGVVFPRRRRLTRLLLACGNLFFRLRRSAFRTYLHPPESIDELIRGLGFTEAAHSRTPIWTMAVYRRKAADPS